MVMVLGMSTMTAFAAGNPDEKTTNDGNVTISINVPENTDEDKTRNETYTAYKIFNVEKNAAGNAYTYYLNSGETQLISLAQGLVDEEGKKYFKSENSADSTRVNFSLVDENTNAIELADALLSALKQANISGTTLVVGSNTVPVGYYVIESTLGSNLVLATTDFEVVEKNNYPTVVKTVDKAYAQIGDTLTYTLTVSVPESAVGPIVLHDTLSDGVTFGAKVNNTKGTYTNSGNVVTINFTADEVAAALGKNLVAQYTGTLNTSAVIGQKSGQVTNSADGGYANDGNFNKVYLEYSKFKTVETGVDTDTYEAVINKIDGTTKNALAGAEFTLTRNNDNTPVKFTLTEAVEADPEAGIEASSAYYTVDPNGSVTTLVSDANGKIDIRGLSAEKYILTETKAPAGYNKLDKTKDLVVNTGVSVTTINVENNTGSVLPSTGGMGTTLFYVFGAVLVIGAGIVLVARRRMAK